MKTLWYGRVGDNEPDHRRYSERVCGCSTCRHFRDDAVQRKRLRCDLCMRKPDDTWPHICVQFVPDLLKQFLGVENLCSCCRNAISCYLREWDACWSQSSDDELKWAMLAYLLEHYYNGHWYMHQLKNKKDCCKSGHLPAQRLAA